MSEMKLLDVNAVSGKSINLKDYSHILAYPNYFMDIGEFVDIVTAYLK